MRLSLILILVTTFHFASAKQVPIDTDASKIKWTGKKIVGDDSHTGTVKIKKGTVKLDKDNKLVGGSLVIDMTSIEDSDLSGKWKKKLEGHLESDDFFNTKEHKEASYKITKVEPGRSNVYTVTGNLTIRGKTHPETFEVIVEKNGKTMVAKGEIKFDRAKYGVKYNSEASFLKKTISIPKDKVIDDDIQLSINLQTEKL
jgi:polyisoprenoid-binding protein YceI